MRTCTASRSTTAKAVSFLIGIAAGIILGAGVPQLNKLGARAYVAIRLKLGL